MIYFTHTRVLVVVFVDWAGFGDVHLCLPHFTHLLED